MSAALNEGCRIASITANHRHSAIHCNLAPRGGWRGSACCWKLQDNGKRGFGGPDACRPDRALITRVHYCVRVQSASCAIGLKVSIIVTEFASRTETIFYFICGGVLYLFILRRANMEETLFISSFISSARSDLTKIPVILRTRLTNTQLYSLFFFLGVQVGGGSCLLFIPGGTHV